MAIQNLYPARTAIVRRYAPPGFRHDNLFFGVLSGVLAVVVFAGFAPSFYLRLPSGDLPQLGPVLIAHIILFTAWMLLFPTQIVLAAAGAGRWHRQLGFAGGLLAALMVVVGIAAQVSHDRRIVLDGSYASNPFVADMGMSLGLLDIAVFAVL